MSDDQHDEQYDERQDERHDEHGPRAPQSQVVDVDDLPGGARGALEAVLMVVDEPISDVALATALGLTRDRVREELSRLAASYVEEGRGFELREVGGAWRFYSSPAYAALVEAFVLDGQQARLTQAALETLAVVAYRQPVARGRVSAIRGVNVDGVMRTLVSRGLVEETGTDHETGAILYGTTTLFLERIGLSSLEELPALAPFLPEVDALDELAGHHTG
ncbi:MAG: SMC-Scp complex subunit ScpB [Actinomycetales bacterium]